MPTNGNKLGMALAEARKDRPIRVVAAAAGISPATFFRMEHGRHCDMDNFVRAMRWLDISKKNWWRFMENGDASEGDED